jgi:hypothetical protein
MIEVDHNPARVATNSCWKIHTTNFAIAFVIWNNDKKRRLPADSAHRLPAILDSGSQSGWSERQQSGFQRAVRQIAAKSGKIRQ